MLMLLVDFLKTRMITGFFTSLTAGNSAQEQSTVNISSLIDSWLLLRDIELGGERNRGLYLLKSRGMRHSNQIREFLLTDQGVELRDVYVGPTGVLTGSARLTQEAQEHAAQRELEQRAEFKQRELENRRLMMEAQITALRVAFEAQEIEAEKLIGVNKMREAGIAQNRVEMMKSRSAD
jgi:circadian clock protein KaiC